MKTYIFADFMEIIIATIDSMRTTVCWRPLWILRP